MLRLLALILLALPASAQSGTVVVPLQFTDNTTQIVLPPPDPGRTHVRFTIDHTYVQSYQVETDEQVQDGAYYWFGGEFTNGWSLKASGVALCGARSSWDYSRFDECDPYDGTFDGAGASGWTVAQDTLTSAGALVSLAALTGPLTLRSEARTVTGVNIGIPAPGYANVTFLARSQARALVHYVYE